jgi:putative 2OG-Fe(II) oxygenase
MESLFNNPTFKTIMESTIGSGYKMSTCSLRLSTGSDDGLGFHTDGMGENGVSILLDDQYISQEGVTAVLRGSHKWPVSSQEVMFDSIPVKLLQPFCTPLTGKKGDIFLFTNKTYHGRIPNHSGNTKLVMLIGFFSVGYEFYRFNVPQSILKNIGPELNRLMDGSNFKPINENGLCQVQSFDGSFPDFIDSLYTRNKSRSLIWSVVRIYPILIVGPIQWLKNKIKSIPT